jgi:immune inhibitor A
MTKLAKQRILFVLTMVSAIFLCTCLLLAVLLRLLTAPQIDSSQTSLMPTPSYLFTQTLTISPTATYAPPAPRLSSKTAAGAIDSPEVIEQTDMPQRDQRQLAIELKYHGQSIPAVVNENQPVDQLGERSTFWVGESDSARFFTATATLRYLTPHAAWWVQDGYQVNDPGLASSAEQFENKIYPTDRDFFGSEWTPGVDNDPRLHVFLGNVPGATGYFYSNNEFSRMVNPYSNEKEMFLINLNDVEPGSPALESVLAHEFQHMIHWNNDRNENTWINEGLSQLAMTLNGYNAGGHESIYLAQPDLQLTSWGNTPNESLPHYGASYLFMSYFLDRFGEKAMRQFVADPANGAQGFDDILAGSNLRFEDVFADWLVANLLQNKDLAGGRFGYKELQFSQPALTQRFASFPADYSDDVYQFGADYLELNNANGAEIAFEGAPTVRLLPNQAHSGTFQWWSNRGDDADSSLTHAFDLSGLQKATLEYSAWYDIEKDWDFAYLEVSADGGSTWEILKTSHTTTDNLSGNNFAEAYTGLSGSSTTASWITETVDLTPFAGKQILVRFEYITDDAVNHPGLSIDDVSVPELGYTSDFEKDDGGWQAEGFIRIGNELPQTYLIQLVKFTDPPVIERFVLDEANRGQFKVSGVDNAVLIISGAAPSTTEKAPYSLHISK